MDKFVLTNYIWIASGILTLIILLYSRIRVPYGRHVNKSWGRLVSNKFGWFWMELPAFLIFPLLVILGPREKDYLTWLLVGLWTIHYFNRTFIFPFRIKTKGKKMPLLIVLSALAFNIINGTLNGLYLGSFGPIDTSLNTWNVYVGLFLFVIGFLINQISDTKLIALRKNSKTIKYQEAGYFNIYLAQIILEK